MTPEVGSEWLAKDGRKMRVDKIVEQTATHHTIVKMTVVNATGRTAKTTQMHQRNFWDGDERRDAFLRPAH